MIYQQSSRLLCEVAPWASPRSAYGLRITYHPDIPHDGRERLLVCAEFHHGFPFYLYAFCCVILILVVWRLGRETKGKTLEQIASAWRPPD